ncbi:MAG: polysaccharide biosynthesis protein [Bacteroidales bacterium]|nr:polysaccharide biosynthesis protein [Bacteroidales bacterium]
MLQLPHKPFPRFIILMLDFLVVLFAVVMSFLLRFNFSIPDYEFLWLYIDLLIIGFARLVLFLVFGTHRGIVRYISTSDALRLMVNLITGSLVFVLANIVSYFAFSHQNIIPYSIIIIELLSSSFLLLGYRVLLKIVFLETRSSSGKKREVIIFGAGESGLITKRSLDRDAGPKFKVLAFVDDDRKKVGKKLEDIPIQSTEKLNDLLQNNAVDQVIISIQSLSAKRKSDITDICLKHEVKVLVVPPVSTWINGQLSFRQIREINIEELLERDVIVINNDKVGRELAGKRILVSGAAGSIGSEIVRQLRQFNPAMIICVDQAETAVFVFQNEIEQGIFKNYNFHIGDICNVVSMQKLFEQYSPEIVFHAAAYKHVPVMELNAIEAIRNNVGGTKVLADLAVEFSVEKFVMISTDKAVNPTNIMGASKRIAEIYVDAKNSLGKTRFITTRFGNVLGSNGSVIPLFRKQIEKGGPLTVTHPDVTRYFMTIPEACQLVLEAGTMGEGGEIFIFDMGESVKIADLAEKMVQLSGLTPGKDIQIQFTGLRPGEKLYEELLATEENTKATYHDRILIADLVEGNAEMNIETIQAFLDRIDNSDDMSLVAEMKKIVPEFISKNSVYQQLDK